jgi:ribosomal protein L22
MKFNLARLNEDTKIVANTDEVFAGTELAEQAFTVTVQKLKRAEKIDTMSKAVKDDGTISNGLYSQALFVSSIQAVDGFVDENGANITLEDGVAEIIWEYAPDALVEEIKKVIQSFNAIDEAKKKEPEEDLVVTQIGV